MAGANRNRSAANWPCSYIIAHIIIVQLNIASAYNQLRQQSYNGVTYEIANIES